MPLSPPTTRNLHIFLAKEEHRGPENLLRHPDRYHYESVQGRDGYLGVLATQRSRPRPPDWLNFFEGAIANPEDLPELITSSASAVFILECAGRTFLLTFGYGRTMIADGVVEPRFGLKATLNAIHPEKLRSLDRKSFERIQRLSREQLSRDSGFYSFGLNVEQDLLCAVVGAPDDEIYGRRLAGRDALTAYLACELEDLPTLLELYLILSEDGGYRRRYPWVDNIAEVADKRTRERLDLELARRIRREELAELVLTPPEIIDWDEFGGLRYRGAASASQYPELAWTDYFEEVRQPGVFARDHLRSDRIFCAKADGSGFLFTWSLHRCIAGELVAGTERYVISDGKWYRIDQDFAERVVAAVRAIPCCPEILPPYAHRNEAEYNQAAADGSGGRWALMDRKLIRTATQYGPVEFCDLFSDQRRMIHVKRYAGSAPLSHLFAQGVVAARLYQSDSSFRHLVNAELPGSHRLPDPSSAVDPRHYEVAFAIIGSAGNGHLLPFFSMVNLRGAVEILSGLGYQTTLTHV